MATDPERLTELTSERNRSPKVGDRGAYVPTAKLVRQARSSILGDAKPGGLYFEMLTYWAFTNGRVTGDSFAEIFSSALRSIADQLQSGNPLIDPALGTPYRPAPSAGDLEFAAKMLDAYADLAEEALTLDRCKAAINWRRILGRNDRGGMLPAARGV